VSVTIAKHPFRAAAAVFIVAATLGLSACMPAAGPIEHFSGVPMVEQEVEPVDEGQAEGEAEEEDQDGAGPGQEEEAGTPMVELEVTEGEPQAVYLEDGTRIALVLWGSSGCPPVGSTINVVNDSESSNAVRVELVPIPEDTVCTTDFVPHTTVFWTPVDVTTTQPLQILVGEDELTLDVK
jgi:hypothetical protein